MSLSPCTGPGHWLWLTPGEINPSSHNSSSGIWIISDLKWLKHITKIKSPNNQRKDHYRGHIPKRSLSPIWKGWNSCDSWLLHPNLLVFHTCHVYSGQRRVSQGDSLVLNHVGFFKALVILGTCDSLGNEGLTHQRWVCLHCGLGISESFKLQKTPPLALPSEIDPGRSWSNKLHQHLCGFSCGIVLLRLWLPVCKLWANPKCKAWQHPTPLLGMVLNVCENLLSKNILCLEFWAWNALERHIILCMMYCAQNSSVVTTSSCDYDIFISVPSIVNCFF